MDGGAGETRRVIHRRQLLEALRRGRGEGMTVKRLAQALSLDPADPGSRDQITRLLAEVEDRGEAVATPSGRWIAVEYTDFWVGTLRLTSRGFGIVRVEGTDLPDVVVPRESLGTALDGDVVMARRGSKRRKGELVPERYGEVIKVVKRRRPTLVGRFRAGPPRPWVEPFARRLDVRVLLDPIDGESPRDGEFVEVAIGEVPEVGPIMGRLLRRLGAPGEAGVDEEVVLAELSIPIDFTEPALLEADALPSAVRPEDLAGRVDHRGQPAVTIDGETARDFDDAVAAFRAPADAIEVFVHIADVSHYVAPGSALDGAARERGTSVYLPGRCVPMLPERLSNHLCSLVAGEDRLSFTVRFLVLPGGAVEGYRAERSVFRSRRRCTYTEVFDWLETGSWPADLHAEARASVELLDEAARRLNRRRRERGAIDFDLPEPEILLDPDGFMTGVRAAPRNRAHRLIEELMVTANECVARLLTWGRQLGMFRVHERPSPGKLAELEAVLEEFGLALRGNLEELPAKELQRLLDEIAGRPEERFLQTLILRSLARAAYLPECRGHYALATDFYLHFTSPIRRYPDLLVHRFLAALLAGRVPWGAERDLAAAELEDLAPHCSFTERRAEEAEREVVKWKQAEFMRAHLGEEFSGHVSGVTAFGLFVQLDEAYVEGLIHISMLADDFYRYDEVGHRLVGSRRGRVFRLGDTMRVRVKGIDEEFMEVQLEPLLEPVPDRRPRPPARGVEKKARGGRADRPPTRKRPARGARRRGR
jgi:ribonuclease R